MSNNEISNKQFLKSLEALIKLSEEVLGKSQKLIEINANKNKKLDKIGFVNHFKTFSLKS